MGSLYTAEADLGWEDDKPSLLGSNHSKSDTYDPAYDEKHRRDVDGEQGLERGWGEHMLSYSSTDIFGEETPRPAQPAAAAAAYGHQSTRSGEHAEVYGWNAGYAQVPGTPSKPRPAKGGTGGTLYRTASRLLPSAVSAINAVGVGAVGAVRRPSWFRRPEPPKDGGPARLYGPRVAPPRVWGMPHPAPAAAYGGQPQPAYAAQGGDGWAHPEEREQERLVRELLLARQMPLQEELAQPGLVYANQHQHGQARYPSDHQQHQQRQQQDYPSYANGPAYNYAPTPLTGISGTSSPSVYSLASPPPAPVRTLSGGGGARQGLGRQKTVRAPPLQPMGQIGESEEWDEPPRGGLAAYRPA